MAKRRLRNPRGWPRLLAAELLIAEAAGHSDKISRLGTRQLLDHALAGPLPLLQEDQEIGHLLPVRPLVELPDDVGADLAGGGQDPKEIPTRRWSERVGEASLKGTETLDRAHGQPEGRRNPRSCRCPGVLVDEPSKEVASLDRTMAASRVGPTLRIDRRAQVQSTVGPLAVVVLDVDTERQLQVPTPEDEHPVQALSPDGSDPSLGEGVGPGSSDASADTWAPWVRKTSSKLETNFESRSLIRKRKGTLSPG